MRRNWRLTAIWLTMPLGMFIPTAVTSSRTLSAAETQRQSAVVVDEPNYFPLPLGATPLRDRNSAGDILPVSYPATPQSSGSIREPQPAFQPNAAQLQPQIQPQPRLAMAPRGTAPAQPVPVVSNNPSGTMLVTPFTTSAPDGTQYMLVPIPANAGNNGQLPMFVMPQGSVQQPQSWGTAGQSQVPQYVAANASRVPTQNFQPQNAPPRPRDGQFDLKPAGEQVNNITRQGFRLAERNALFAAKEQFVQALRMAAQTLDACDGGDRHLRDLTGALTALDEAEDFAPKGGTVIDSLNVTEIVGSHRTQIFPSGATQQLSSLEALQYYYQFAQQQMTSATGEIRNTADAYFGLGKVHALLTQDAGPLTQLHAARAIVFQQTALAIHPDHDKASNELGVMLARHGQWGEAKKALLHSLRTKPRAETWHNLAVIHQRLGEHDLAQRALWEQQQRSGGGTAPGPASGVQWVESQQFARMQPGPGNPQQGQQPQQPMTATQPRTMFPSPAMQRR